MTFEDIPKLLYEIASTLSRIEKQLAGGNTMHPADEQDYMNIQQAAKYLKISNQSMYIYVNQGKIKAAKPGKTWVLKKTDLDDFIKTKYQTIEPHEHIVNHRKT